MLEFQQIVDGFTKPITGDEFILFQNRLRVLTQKLSPIIHNIGEETKHKFQHQINRENIKDCSHLCFIKQHSLIILIHYTT